MYNLTPLQFKAYIENCILTKPWFTVFLCLYPPGTKALSTQDLGILLVVCHSAAPRWKTVGIHLGIDVAELEIIRRHPELIVEGVEGYFQEMLTMWLKQAPPKHQLPCLESRAYALRNVGEERLAMELPESFLQAKGHLCAVCSFISRLLFVTFNT